MNFIALKMLMGDRGKYLGIVLGLAFTSLIMTQQPAIFVGVMARTYSLLSDMPGAQIWVMDPKVQYVDDLKPLQDTELFRVRSVEGVQWAVPLYKGNIRARLTDGTFQTCILLGLDDASLFGGPQEMVTGRVADLRQSDAVIVDEVAATTKLAHKGPDGKLIPLAIGDSMELNDTRATVAGIARITRTFQSQPVLYTTYSRAIALAPRERMLLSFVLAKAKPGVDPALVAKRIAAETGLAAYTHEQFQWLTVRYYMRNTGIPINFGVAVLLGFIVGAAIAGQTFYNFTAENLRQFGALKAMGTTDRVLLKMILLQALVVGCIGYGIGVGATAVFGFLVRGSQLAFKFPWYLLVFSATAVTLIVLTTAIISIRKVIKLEPAIVFKGA